MNIIAWIIVGLIAGWLAGLVMRGGGFGIVGDIIVGILGALIGGFIAGLLFGGDYVTGLNVGTIIVAFIGAVILVAIVRAVAPGRTSV